MERGAVARGSFAAACSEPVGCLANIEPAVEVEVRDRVSSELLTTTPRGVVQTCSRSTAVAFFDALRVKIHDEGVVRTEAVYLALGITRSGIPR